jgi:hypothetical protein
MTGKASVKDMVNSIIADLTRLAFQRMVTAPLVGAFDGFLSQFSTASSLGTNIGSQQTAMLASQTSVFANGGVMTALGEMPLRAYSKGGIATSPQLALYGEGSTPEAYVPLPDGRRIPVAMQGNGSGEVTVNVYNQPGSNAKVEQRQTGNGLEIDVIIEQVETGMARNIQRGNGLAPVIERQYGLNRAAGVFR